MFDLGFSELVVCFVIALVVLGPTRLPGLVAKVGRWVGKARSMARQFREQLESEINLDELKRTTEKRANEALGLTPTPAPPPEFSGDPPFTPAATEPVTSNPPASAYPYDAQEPAPAEPSSDAAAPAAPQPGDDTYSHAHAAGEAPVLTTEEVHPETPASADTSRPAA